MATGTRVDGLKQVLADLKKLGIEVDDFKESFGNIASRGAALAASYVNSQTGRLAGTVRGNKAKNKSVIIAGRSSVRWAGVQNYGWKKRNIEPQRFMQKADEQLAGQLPALLQQELQDKIQRRGLA